MGDVNNKILGRSGADRRLSVLSRRMKWLIAALVLMCLVTLGLAGVIMYPNLLCGIFGEWIIAGGSKTQASTAYLGVEIEDLQAGTAQAMGLPSSGGVVVSRVFPSSPAAQSGLEQGDIILQFDRSRVGSSSELQNMLAAADPGDTVRIVVDRDGRARTFYVELTQRPSSLMQAAYTPDAQTNLTVEWGCTLSPITAELTRQLSIPPSIKGVVVVAVAPTGLAKSAGILPGDVIVSVNRRPTEDLASFYKAIEDQQTVVLEIYRSGRVLYVQLQAGSASPPLATIAGSLADYSTLPRRVAVAATGADLNAQMALRFGTAPYFVIVDLDANRFQLIQNTGLADARGFGLVAAQLVAAQGAGSTIAGAYGQPAYDALKALNIQPFVANPGKVSDIINQYRSSLLTQVVDPTLPGYGYAQNIITTGGPPTDDDDEDEEEEGGYKGIPYTIPPQGKYDPALDPANAAELTAGSTLNLNQQTQFCYCPTCNIVYEHPASVPCSSLVCKECGSRLISLSSGARSSPVATVAGSSLAQRVAIASNGNDLSAPMALRFGTAPYFIIVDLSTNRFVAVSNSALASTGGYGVAAAQLVAAQGAGATVAGAYGSQAYFALKALNINPFVASLGRVSDVLNQYRLSALSQVTVPLAPGSNAQALIVTGGPPTDDDDEDEEEEGGYKGMPYTIPPQGKYDPALDPANAGQIVAGSTTQTQRADYCYCPNCGISVAHPAGVSCSQLTCPQCGNRLMNLDASSNLAPGMTGTTAPLSTYTYSQALQPTQPLSTYNQVLLPTQTQTRTGSTGTGIPGTLPGGSTGSLYLDQQSLYLNQQSQYCLCPVCNITYEHPAGVPCSSLACKVCGSRLISLNPGAGTSLPIRTSAGTTVSGMPATIPPMGQTSAGTVVAGMPVSGMPATIPPMGQTSAGTTNLSTGALQGAIDGNCVCPRCGTTVPHLRGTACYTIPCPKCGTLMVNEGAVLNSLGVAGTVVSGMPATIPPMGQTSAGTVVAGMPVSGMPEEIPPPGGGNPDNLTVAGIPNISAGTLVAGMPVSGMPETIPPSMGQTTAGMPVAGLPETIPPTGQTTSVITVAGTASAALTVAGAGTGKICIAATGPKIDSPVADLFDRAPYFLIVGLGNFTAIPNPNVRDVTGAGIQSAQFVVSEGAKAVITNDIGIRAIEELKRLQVQVYTGVTGTAAQALQWYQNNRLTPTNLSASSTNDEDEEEHGPPTSKAKSKGETKAL